MTGIASRARRMIRYLPAGLLAGIWGIAVLRILTGPTSRLFSNPAHMEEDLSLHVWQYWWVWRALAHGLDPFRSNLLTFPAELDLRTLWGGHLDLLVGTPVTALLGPLAAHDAVVMAMLALNGLGVALLAREVSGSSFHGAMAGCLSMTSPILLKEALAGRVEEMSLGLLAMGLAWGLRHWRAGRRADLLLSVAAFGASFLAWAGAAMMALVLLPALGTGAWLSARGERRSGIASPAWSSRRAVALGLGMVALLGAMLAYGISGLGTRWLWLPGDTEALRTWTCRSLTVDVPLQSLLDPRPTGLPVSLGPVLPLAALLALVPGRGRALPWWIAGGVLLVLSAGPDLAHVRGLGTIPSPYRWLPYVVPFFGRFHWPYRFLLLAAPVLAVLAALGITRARERLPRSRPLAALPIALVVLAALQVHRLLPLPVLEVPPLPDTYRALAGRPGAILELAWPHHAAYDPRLAQIHHGRPTCCLDLPRELRPPDLVALQERHGLLALTARWSDARGAAGYAGPVDPRALAGLGFTHVVVHRSDGRRFEHYAQGEVPDPTRETRRPDGACPGSVPPPPGISGLGDAGEGSERFLRGLFGPPVSEEALPDGTLVLYTVGGSPGAGREVR